MAAAQGHEPIHFREIAWTIGDTIVDSVTERWRGESMNFLDAVKICFVKYADFNGCSSRSEFWWWFLFTGIAGLALQVISTHLSAAFSIATLLPSFAVGARRLHDADRSGWWQLLYFLPVVGWIVLIIFWAEPGKQSRYAQ